MGERQQQQLYIDELIKRRKESNLKQGSLPDETSDDTKIDAFINSVILKKYENIRNITGMANGDPRQIRFAALIVDARRMIRYLATYRPQMSSDLYGKMMYGYVKNLILTQTDYDVQRAKMKSRRISYFKPLQTSEISNLQLKSFMSSEQSTGLTLETNEKGTIRVVGLTADQKKEIKDKFGAAYYLLKLVRANNEYIRKKNNIKRIIQDLNYDEKKFNRRFLKAAVTGGGGFKKLLNNQSDFDEYGNIYTYQRRKRQNRITNKSALLHKQYETKMKAAIAARTKRFDHYQKIIDRGGDDRGDGGDRGGGNQGANQGANQGPNQGANQGPNQGANEGANQGANQGANEGDNQMDLERNILGEGRQIVSQRSQRLFDTTLGTPQSNAFLALKRADDTQKRGYIQQAGNILQIQGSFQKNWDQFTPVQKHKIIKLLQEALTPLLNIPASMYLSQALTDAAADVNLFQGELINIIVQDANASQNNNTLETTF